MPRPRLYANDAERQAAHRHRQAQKQAASKGAYQSIWIRLNRLQAAITTAAAAGDPEAQVLLKGTVPETVDALSEWWEHRTP